MLDRALGKLRIESVEDRHEPWEGDTPFHSAYNRICNPEPYTVVDIIRCWELWDIVTQLEPLAGALLEVGCWKGGTGAIIACAAREAGINETVYLCDTFTGTVKGSDVDGIYAVDGQFGGITSRYVRRLVRRFKLSNVKILEGIFPDQTKQYVKETLFRFCHIDVDTYQSAKDVFNYVWPKLSIGGVIVYDDYGYLVTPGISKHVNEVRYGYDRLSLYNLNEHAIIIKT